MPVPSNRRILLCCSGSVATVKVPQLAYELSLMGDVRIVCTNAAEHFLKRAKDYHPESWKKFLQCGGLSLIVSDVDEWKLWNRMGDPVLHIELRRWADVVVVAPASADLMAKASNGICDNLCLCVLRAWDFRKPCIVCPAMNTFMWDHPATQSSLDKLRSWGMRVVDPVSKTLACNDNGNGALAHVDDIVAAVREVLQAAGVPPNDQGDVDQYGSTFVDGMPAKHRENENAKFWSGIVLATIPFLFLVLGAYV